MKYHGITLAPTAMINTPSGQIGASNNLMSTQTITTLTTSNIKPSFDSTSSIQITKADGTTSILTINTLQSRIGIGCSPSSPLDVQASLTVGDYLATFKNTNSHTEIKIDSNAADKISNLHFANGGTQKWTVSSRGTYDSPNDRLSFYTGSTGVITLSSDAKVGVGTVNPSKQLHVKSATPVLRLEDSDQTSPAVPWDIEVSGTDFYIKEQANSRTVFKGTAAGNTSIYAGDTEPLSLFSGGYARANYGILFGTDTAAANALDDYEEGTWTPTFYGFTTAGTQTYTTQTGVYTKVGRLVTVSFYVNINTKDGSTSGMWGIGGLPFTILSGSGRGGGTVGGWYGLAGSGPVSMRLWTSSGETVLRVVGNTGQTTETYQFDTTNFQSGTQLWATTSYITS